MLKVAVFLAIAIIVWRFAFGSWPWAMVSTSRKVPHIRVETETEARRILGVGPEASKVEIAAAHRALIARIHPDKGGDAVETARANAARDLLIERPPKDREV